ncbi:MAG: type I methionyl aminopeptidase, partial [Bdellovibrionaceae bacterium]|nr:type I methionyl aminopeptidase [Pseudobdellovibrionaceae bacterium]
MPQILDSHEIPLMRQSCKLAAQVLVFIEEHIQPGLSTQKLDELCHDFIISHGAIPAPLNYNGFPKSICTSINSCICHGVPDSTILNEGDIINIDVTCIKNGFYGDTSKTFFVGEVSKVAKDLTDCAYQSMHKGIEAIRPNGTTGDIGFNIEKYSTRKGFFPVREIGGHGIGKVF